MVREGSAHSARVLIADDNEVDRRHFRRLLEAMGHVVIEAEDGEEALATARAKGCDLILLDLHMPVMDGEEVLQEIQVDARLQEIPVLILTSARSDDEVVDEVRFIDQGAEDYLSKTGDSALLQARVTNCLQKKWLRDEKRRMIQGLRDQQGWVNRLLNALLPNQVVQQFLNEREITFAPQRYRAAVMFCDIVDFTQFCEGKDPQEVVEHLDRLVSRLEEICAEYRLEKIKTIGDSFMATSGMLTYVENPVHNCINAAEVMQAAAAEVPPHWQLRIGIDFGSFVAGIVGREKFQFDVWGQTINTAARIESEGENGAINLSQAAWNEVSELVSCRVTHRELKGVGVQPVYVVNGSSS